MDATVVIVALAVTVDNLRVSVPLGTALPDRSARLRLAAGFAAAETVAPLLGASVGAAGSAALGSLAQLGALLLIGLGVVLTLLPAPSEPDSRIPMRLPWIAVWLPLVLSVDNAAAGLGLGLLGYHPLLSAVVVGGLSGCLSLIGLELGARVSSFRLSAVRRLGGVGLVLVGIAMIVGG